MKEENKSKLKNKKKDVIVVDNNYNNSSVNNLNNEKLVKQNEEELVNTVKDDIIVNEINSGSNKKVSFSTPSNLNKVESTDDNNTMINKILFNIQLLAAMTNKMNEKLVYLLSTFISHEHLKGILEERDCREVCASLICGESMKKLKQNEKKYFYNIATEDFKKENLLDFFCDVKCFQKFKDISEIAKNFDYFHLLNIESIYLFSILCDFFPKNSYLDEISKCANLILNKSKKISEENLAAYKLKYIKYFTQEEIKFNEKEETITDLFSNMEINKK